MVEPASLAPNHAIARRAKTLEEISELASSIHPDEWLNATGDRRILPPHAAFPSEGTRISHPRF